jgi:hypothetical protein
VAATKRSFDVAGSFAIAIRAIASDRLEKLNGRSDRGDREEVSRREPSLFAFGQLRALLDGRF